ncbi:MAG: hypothetical protein GXO60_02500 [Epsilonproteobacteria bacterium]|nr:hypothetical protein [Campylobacterota bacterium]
MQIIIFLIEVVLIFFLVDMDNIAFKSTKIQNIQYTSYNILDEEGNTHLVLSSLPKEQKVYIWQNSSIKDEMMEDFPNLCIMSEFVDSRIEDNGTFKENLIEYMEYIQGRYLSGEIDQKEFRDAIEHPHPSLPTY